MGLNFITRHISLIAATALILCACSDSKQLKVEPSDPEILYMGTYFMERLSTSHILIPRNDSHAQLRRLVNCNGGFSG